jgi:hypothetical protein
MDEDLRTAVLHDESEPFVGIKPLHGSVRRGTILLAWGGKKAATRERKIIKKTATGLKIAGAAP